MQIFSSYLNDYIRQKNITYKRAAEMCRMDRSQLKRFAEGKRLPKNETIVIKIAQGLNMSLEDTLQMRKEYIRSKMGKNWYAIYTIIDEVWDGIRVMQLNDNMKQTLNNAKVNITDVKYLCGKEEIYHYVDYICCDAEHIYVEMNPEYKEVFEMLKCAASRNKNCFIEHLIVVNSFLENSEGSDAGIFENVLSCIILGDKYKIYHKYRRKISGKKGMPSYSYILAERGIVIICNYINRLTGLFISEPEILSYYQDRFRKAVSGSYLYGMACKLDCCINEWRRREFIRNRQNGMIFETGINYGRKSIRITNQDTFGKSIFIEEGNIVAVFEEFIQSVKSAK